MICGPSSRILNSFRGVIASLKTQNKTLTQCNQTTTELQNTITIVRCVYLLVTAIYSYFYFTFITLFINHDLTNIFIFQFRPIFHYNSLVHHIL